MVVDKTKLNKAYSILGEQAALRDAVEPKKERNVRALIEEQTRQICKATGKPTLTVNDIIKVLGVSQSAAYKLVNSKEMQTVTIGKRKIIAATVLAEILIEGRKI